MARTGRPNHKPTRPKREKVKLLRADGWAKDRIARYLEIDPATLEKHYAAELEHGADVKRAELLDRADKASKKGNMTAVRWLHDRSEAALAAQQLEQRANRPAEEAAKPLPVGKKEQRQKAAEEIATAGSVFAPPSGPTVKH